MHNLKFKFYFQRKMARMEAAKADAENFARDGELDVVVDDVGSVVGVA
jgi:hypothetical protein